MTVPQWLAPANVAALAAALRRATPSTRLVAGGTDLMLELRVSAAPPDLLIDLSGLRELAFIRGEGPLIRIGALTTFADLQHSALLQTHAPCLVQAAARVGSAQIRNSATIGGNVAHASPCADAIPVLLALGADVGVLQSDGAIDRKPVSEVLSATGGSRLRPDEAIVDFAFQALVDSQRSAFAKVGARTSVAVAKLNAAMVLHVDDGGRRIVEASIAVGSVAPTAFLSRALGDALRDQPFSADTAERFAQACSQLVASAIPDRDSRHYKQHAIRGLAADLWSAVDGAFGADSDLVRRPER